MYKINDSNTNHVTSKLFVTIYNDYVYFKKKDYIKKVVLKKVLLECLIVCAASNSNASLHIQRNPCKKNLHPGGGKLRSRKSIP